MKKVFIKVFVLILAMTLVFTSCNTSGSNETETEKVWKPGDLNEFYSEEETENPETTSEKIEESAAFTQKKDELFKVLIDGFVDMNLILKQKSTNSEYTMFELYNNGYDFLAYVVVVHKMGSDGKSYSTGVYSWVDGLPTDAFTQNTEFFKASFSILALASAFYINDAVGSNLDGLSMYNLFSEDVVNNNSTTRFSNDVATGAYSYFKIKGMDCLYVNYVTGIFVACDAGVESVAEIMELDENKADVSSEANSDKQVSTEEVGSFAESVELTTKREEPTTKKEPTTVWEPSTEAMHIHSYVNHEGKKATCTEGGYSSYKTCSCGYTDYSEIPAMGHDYALVETKNPTCEEEGYEKYSCINCTDSYKNSERALGHDFSEATCVAPKTCANCGKTEGIVSDHVMNYAECKYCDYKDYSCFAFSSNEFYDLSWYRVLPEKKAVNLEDGEASITIDKNGNGKIKFADYSFTFKLGKQRVESHWAGHSLVKFSVIVNGNEIGGYDSEGITFVGDDRCYVDFHEAQCDDLGPEFSDISQIKFYFYMN